MKDFLLNTSYIVIIVLSGVILLACLGSRLMAGDRLTDPERLELVKQALVATQARVLELEAQLKLYESDPYKEMACASVQSKKVSDVLNTKILDLSKSHGQPEGCVPLIDGSFRCPDGISKTESARLQKTEQ